MVVDIDSLINFSSDAGAAGGLQPTSWDIAASNALPAGFRYQVDSSSISLNGVGFKNGY